MIGLADLGGLALVGGAHLGDQICARSAVLVQICGSCVQPLRCTGSVRGELALQRLLEAGRRPTAPPRSRAG